MKYEIKYIPAKEALTVSAYKVICLDAEATVFMKAINKEINRLEASRKREIREGFKEGMRSIPHASMKKIKDGFSFDAPHADDVCAAARNAIGQSVKSSFFLSPVEITENIVADFEKAVDEKRV